MGAFGMGHYRDLGLIYFPHLKLRLHLRLIFVSKEGEVGPLAQNADSRSTARP